MTDIRYGVTQALTPSTSSTLFQVTIPGLGFTPKAVRITYGAAVNATNTDNGAYGVGMSDGINQVANAYLTEVGVAAPNGRSTSDNNFVLSVLTAADAGNVAFAIDALTNVSTGPIADGWDFFMIVNSIAAAQLITVEYFGGDDLEVEVVNFQYDGTPFTGLGITPNFVFLNTIFLSGVSGIRSNESLISMGAAWDGPTIQQGSMGVCNSSTQTTTAPTQHWSSDDIMSFVLDDNTNPFFANVTSFDANGITMVVNSGAIPSPGNVSVYAMFMNIGDNKAFVGPVNAPTSTGATEIELGFKPVVVNVLAGAALNFNVNISDSDSESISVGYSDGANYSSAGTALRRGETTFLTRRYTNDKPIYLIDYGPIGVVNAASTRTLYEVSTLLFTESGFTFSASIVDAAVSTQRQWLVFAIGGIVPSITVDDVVNPIRIDIDLDSDFDISYDSQGDFVTTLGFDTAIKMSILCEQRADPEEVPLPQLRRGWIGSLDSDFEPGSKLWLSDQTRRVQSTLNDIQEAAENGLQWFLADNLADTVSVTTAFSIDGVSIEVTLSIENKPTETELFRLWEHTGT